jgi:hypothetical protein
MDIAELMRVVEGAGIMLPGHEATERDALLREIWRKPAIREPIRLRVVRC